MIIISFLLFFVGSISLLYGFAGSMSDSPSDYGWAGEAFFAGLGLLGSSLLLLIIRAVLWLS